VSRSFHISDVISVLSGRNLSSRGLDGVIDTLRYVTGADVQTVLLPEYFETAKAAILGQHPQLAGVDPRRLSGDNFEEWLEEQVVDFGETLELERFVSEVPKFG